MVLYETPNEVSVGNTVSDLLPTATTILTN